LVALSLLSCGQDPGGDEGVGVVQKASCLPITCYNYGATCGTIPDGCGGTENCGTCPSGQVCTNNNCYASNCQPLTCQQVGANCGQTGNGCGGIIDCGTCPVGSYCNDIVCVHLCDPATCPKPVIRTTEFQPCSGGVCFMGNGNTGIGFATTPTAINGSISQSQRPFTWSLVGGSLPGGLKMDPSFGVTNTLVHGTPTTPGTSTFTIHVEDDAQETAEQVFTITIGTGNLDSLAITSATYNTAKSRLFVAANDPNADAVLTLFLTAGSQRIGTLSTAGTGSYSGTFTVSRALNPTNVTVKSSQGASASSAVHFFSKY
jgi:hypothetical protein